MRRLLALFGRQRPFARAVNLYASEDAAIVAPMHRTPGGIYYEQSAPVVLPGLQPADALGRAFQDAFERCSVKDADLRSHKRSDWPAYRASGLRTIKEFERRFRLVGCLGLDEVNAVVQASTIHPGDPDVSLSVSFNPRLSPEQVGEQLIRLLAQAATTEQPPH